jgi:hypothetical protein
MGIRFSHRLRLEASVAACTGIEERPWPGIVFLCCPPRIRRSSGRLSGRTSLPVIPMQKLSTGRQNISKTAISLKSGRACEWLDACGLKTPGRPNYWIEANKYNANGHRPPYLAASCGSRDMAGREQNRSSAGLYRDGVAARVLALSLTASP